MGTLFAGLALLSPQAGEIFKTFLTIGIFLANLWLFVYMGSLLYKAIKESNRTKRGIQKASLFAQRMSTKMKESTWMSRIR